MPSPFRPPSPAEDLPPYYNDLRDENIQHSFRNFDTPATFDAFDRQTRNPLSKNFCLDFGEHDAYCAFDLAASSYAKLLAAPRPAALHTRWINVWMPYAQRDLLGVLGRCFDFTPRLLGMMGSEPEGSRRERSDKGNDSGEWSEKMDEESVGRSEIMEETMRDGVGGLGHWRIVEDVWHWSTVDWGRRFVCIGYNSLHNIRTKPSHATASSSSFSTSSSSSSSTPSSPDVPHAKRIWTWLLLCEDKTVISISEDAFPSHTSLSATDFKTLYTTRRNLVNVFRQLSKAPTPLGDAALTQLPIRNRVGDSQEETAHRPSDAPGLLFYYLFEDWGATFALIARRGEGYAAELDRLRREMLVTASLTHIDQLHHIGCQLAVLKRVYLAYTLIISRVLVSQSASLASLKNSHIMSGAESFASVAAPHNLMPEADSLLGVGLSSAAKVRFERLKDRIQLYALSEIEECLAQKEALVMMSFNLIAIKESLSVERLTWVTLLLAKITILFTPVTLMTGYFSIQFRGVEFEVLNYWWVFGVVFGGSAGLLVMFSFLSGTFEGKVLARSWSRVAWEGGRRWVSRRRKGGKMG